MTKRRQQAAVLVRPAVARSWRMNEKRGGVVERKVLRAEGGGGGVRVELKGRGMVSVGR